MPTPQHRRRYESLHRATQAQQTRSAIAEAARELFLQRGWAATTVRDVAQAAGVSAPTVYAAYGNKAGLTRALVESVSTLADARRQLAELEGAAGPSEQLAAMVAFDRRLFQRAGDMILLARDAGRVETELADMYHRARGEADETRIQVISAWPEGTLRSGVSLDDAVDIYAAICHVDAYTVLTGERGWSPERTERWWTEALVRLLLHDA